MISIVLIEDHHLVRQALRTLLAAEPDFEVVGEEADGLDAVRLVERTKPQVAITDLMLPSLNGFEVTRQITRRSPQTRVVILSMYSSDAYVREALKNGASAYVLKCSQASDLTRAVREVASGRRYLSPPLLESGAAASVRLAPGAGPDPHDTLTNREREILQLAAEGQSSTEVAARLSISRRTVETHRTNLMRKLGLHSQTELVRYAVQKGLLKFDR